MNHHKLVLPEHLNHRGALFGGYLLKWIDEVAFITANLDYPGNNFVTISLDNVVFKKRIECGQILCFSVERARLGTTSVGYEIKVYGERDPKSNRNILFETKITFVNVTETGTKHPIEIPGH